MTQKVKHEDFETKDQKKEVIRGDRHEFSQISSHLKLPNGTFEVLNYSAFGVAILADKDPGFAAGSEHEGKLIVDGIEIDTYALTFLRKEDVPLGGVKVVFELKSGAISSQSINSVIQMRQILNTISEQQQLINELPETFKRLTFEAKLFLQTLEREIEELRASKGLESLEEIHHFEKTLIVTIGTYLSEFFKPAYGQLADSLKTIDEAKMKAIFPKCVEFFRSQLKDLIYQSPFSNRSVTKPLGYAGDFEMMNIIYRDEHAGQSLFGKCLHYYWLQHPEAKAVRNRSHFLHEKLVKLIQSSGSQPTKCLSVACGPAKEVQMLLDEKSKHDLSHMQFDLLDQDLAALKFASQKIRELSSAKGTKIKANFINKAIKTVISKGLDENQYDLIYSAGLFDYFSDPVAQMAAKVLFGHLKKGGRLIIGNFNLTTPNQFTMRLALDWSLIYRSNDELTRLFGDLTDNFHIEQEPEGVNLFCVLQK